MRKIALVGLGGMAMAFALGVMDGKPRAQTYGTNNAPSGPGWMSYDSAGALRVTGGGGGGAVTLPTTPSIANGSGVVPTQGGAVLSATNGLFTNIIPFTAVAPVVSASGAVTSLVLKASATTATGGVKYFHGENATAAGGYCILYNGTAAPGTGALTAANVLAFQLLPASGFCDWSATSIPIAASTGAVVLISSAATPFTYTTGVITASIYGLAQ